MSNYHDKLTRVVQIIEERFENSVVDIDFCIPEVSISSKECDVWDDPYIIIKYITNQNNIPWRRIRLSKSYLDQSPEKIAYLVSLSIEQFIEEIESMEFG